MWNQKPREDRPDDDTQHPEKRPGQAAQDPSIPDPHPRERTDKDNETS